MNIYQKYFLIIIYIFTSIYATFQIFTSDYKMNKKIYLFFMLWLLPYIGYLFVMFKYFGEDYNKKIEVYKKSKIFHTIGIKESALKWELVTAIYIYVLLYIFLGFVGK